ncbi:MAG: hypothetical protein ACTIJK_09450 [Brachybacterium sp.]
MDIQNHYYGHSAALALHAGLRSVRHIDGLLQHGWTVRSPTLVHFSDFAKLPRTAARLVWSHTARGWDPADDALRQSIARHELGHEHLRDAPALRTALGWDRSSPGPLLSYWGGAPLRKAGAVLGLVKRPAGVQDAGSGGSPLVFLRHPLSHLPSRLPRLPEHDALLPEPLVPTW